MLKALIEEGVLVEIQGESLNGVKTWLVQRDNLPLLQRAADGELQAQRTTFLAPFDSLFWAWDRDQVLWGFNQVLECYKPETDRIYGYFCFPILHKDRLVGRFDPNLDRKSGVLHLNALYLEPGIEPDEALVADVAAAMRDFMAWHGAKESQIEKSDPAVFGEKLMRAVNRRRLKALPDIPEQDSFAMLVLLVANACVDAHRTSGPVSGAQSSARACSRPWSRHSSWWARMAGSCLMNIEAQQAMVAYRAAMNRSRCTSCDSGNVRK